MNRFAVTTALIAALVVTSSVAMAQKGKVIGESSKLGSKAPLKGEEVAVLDTDAGQIIVNVFPQVNAHEPFSSWINLNDVTGVVLQDNPVACRVEDRAQTAVDVVDFFIQARIFKVCRGLYG